MGPSQRRQGRTRTRRCSRKARKVWNVSQPRSFLDKARADRFYALWVLEATSGMRRCGLVGARRGQLDLERGTLSIETTRVVVNAKFIESDGKTQNAQRVMALDPFTLEVRRVLVDQFDAEHADFGPDYQDRGLFSAGRMAAGQESASALCTPDETDRAARTRPAPGPGGRRCTRSGRSQSPRASTRWRTATRACTSSWQVHSAAVRRAAAFAHAATKSAPDVNHTVGTAAASQAEVPGVGGTWEWPAGHSAQAKGQLSDRPAAGPC